MYEPSTFVNIGEGKRLCGNGPLESACTQRIIRYRPNYPQLDANPAFPWRVRGVERPFLARGCVGDCNCDSMRSAARDVDPDPVGRYDGLWAIGPHLSLRTTEAHYRHDCWEISSLNPLTLFFQSSHFRLEHEERLLTAAKNVLIYLVFYYLSLYCINPAATVTYLMGYFYWFSIADSRNWPLPLMMRLTQKLQRFSKLIGGQNL